jgi:hypothetical protein
MNLKLEVVRMQKSFAVEILLIKHSLASNSVHRILMLSTGLRSQAKTCKELD